MEKRNDDFAGGPGGFLRVVHVYHGPKNVRYHADLAWANGGDRRQGQRSPVSPGMR
jgi:hypothetical protein